VRACVYVYVFVHSVRVYIYACVN